MSWTATISKRVRELRRKRGWSAQRLAEEMTAVGVPWERQVVTKLENGQRQAVSVDEAMALAYILDVAPMHFLVPTTSTYVRIVPSPRPDAMGETATVVDAAVARDWICGEQPLPETDVRIYLSEVDEKTFRARFGQGWTPPSEDGDDAG